MPIKNIRSLIFIFFIFLYSTATQIYTLAPYISFRSQGRNKANQMVGSVGHIHLCDKDDWWTSAWTFLGYMQTFRNHEIARCIFGHDLLCDENEKPSIILIQGSQVPNRNPHAWLADYFYLPIDFNGSFQVNPSIKNIILDLDVYIGLDRWWHGLYAWVYGPLCHTRWDLNFKEQTSFAGITDYPAGYFTPNAVPRAELLPNFTAYASGRTLGPISGIIFHPLQFSKLPRCSHAHTGFAELRAECGWNWLLTECGHIGINVQAAAPTGTKPDPTYLFHPIVGNGGHWELGGGISAHYLFYTNELHNCQFGFYLDANLTHLFGIRQLRTFDLCNKPNSRYMLLELVERPIENNLSGSTQSNIINMDNPIVNPNSQFMREFTPLANLSTDFVKVSAGVQADIVALFNYTQCGFSFDVGYNFWALSCERIECPESGNMRCDAGSLCTSAQESRWALKGDARVFGYMIEAGINLPAGAPVALSGTESAADIHNGTNSLVTDPAAANDPFRKNYGVDTPRFAYGDASNNALVFSPTNLLLTDQIKTTIVPQFVSCTMINFQRNRGISHKIFTHLSYTYEHCFHPFFGFGGSAEFGSNKHPRERMQPQMGTLPNFNTRCSECLTCSLSQWSVWIKGGITF